MTKYNISSEEFPIKCCIPFRLNYHQVTDRMQFVHGSWWQPVAVDEVFDLVVSNPPYIDPKAMDGLEDDVRRFEPPLALFARAAEFKARARVGGARRSTSTDQIRGLRTRAVRSLLRYMSPRRCGSCGMTGRSASPRVNVFRMSVPRGPRRTTLLALHNKNIRFRRLRPRRGAHAELG